MLYVLKTAGASPVLLADMKSYMKVTSSADDALIQAMIDAATEWGEKYTGREFTANTWQLLLDSFAARIELRRSPVDTIDSITHLVSGSPVTIATSVYYLKKGNFCSEVLLQEDQSWPTNTDEREQAITIEFTTEKYRCGDMIDLSIKRHVAFWYQNRGDCSDCDGAASGSGVTAIYDLFKIPRT